ncbi:MAG: arylsulfatase A-like enzyme, partial [Planctomycetota bacterium]
MTTGQAEPRILSQVKSRSRNPLKFATLLGCLSLLGSSCEQTIPIPKRVLLVVTDATHSKHLSCYGSQATQTPNLDSLAANGVMFSRAFSNNTWTLPSTASLFTGQLQESHGVVTRKHRLDESAITTAEQFQEAGYATAAFVQMAYASPQFGFNQGFDKFLYYGAGQPGRAGQTITHTMRWLEQHRDEKWFVYLHLRRPHSPYDPNKTALKRLDELANCSLAHGDRNEEFKFADVFGDRELEEFERAHIEHLYGANLETTDTLLGKVFDHAREQEALIVVTSDHGEAIGQHGSYGHGKHLYAESIDIPLLFWWPGADAHIDDLPASTIDVMPTLSQICALPPKRRSLWDGQSLVPRMLAQSTDDVRPVFSTGRYNPGAQPKIAVIDGPWKLIWDQDGSTLLFNRQADVDDDRDLSSTEIDRVAQLSKVAEAWHKQNAAIASQGIEHEGIDPEIAE